MKLAKLHRILGLVFAPFFLLAAVTGATLLWRKAEVYGAETKDLMLGLHTWEIATKYVGVILAAGLIFMTLTGLTMFFQSTRKRT